MSANTDKLARMGIVHSAPTSSHDEVEALLSELYGLLDPPEFAKLAALLRKQADLLAERAASIAYQNQRIVTLMAAPLQQPEPRAFEDWARENIPEGADVAVVMLCRRAWRAAPTSEWNDAIEACDLATRDHAQAMIGRIIRGLKREPVQPTG